MAWRRQGGKRLSKPMMARLLTHICVTWPQWHVEGWISFRKHINVFYIFSHGTGSLNPSSLIRSSCRVNILAVDLLGAPKAKATAATCIDLFVLDHSDTFQNQKGCQLISPSAAYMLQSIRSALVQIMACRLFSAKPLSKPMLGYCQLDP